MSNMNIIKKNARALLLAPLLTAGFSAHAALDFSLMNPDSKSYYMGTYDDYLKTNAHMDIAQLDAESLRSLTTMSNNVVIVDGAKTSDHQLMKVIMDAGNVVIFVRDASVVDDIENGPGRLDAMHTNEDGQMQSSNVFGYYQPLSGPSASFYSGETDPVKAAVLAKEWAEEVIAKNNELQTENLMQAGEYELQSPHPAYAEKHTRTYSGGNHNYRFNARTSYYRLDNDGDNAKDFWVAELKGELIPQLPGHTDTYNSRSLFTKLDVKAYNSSFYISDYAPTLSSDGHEYTIDLDGVQWAYDASSMTVHNQSDSSQGIASWKHEFPNGYHIVSRDTAVIAPGVEFVTPNGNGSEQIWNQVYETQVATFETGPLNHRDVAVHFGAFGTTELHNTTYIRNKQFNKCLTWQPSDKVIEGPCHGWTTQRFYADVRVEDSANGDGIDNVYHMFKNDRAPGKCLKIGNRTANMVSCNTSDSKQLFKIEHLEGNWNRLRNRDNRCITLWSNSREYRDYHACKNTNYFKFRFYD